MLAPTTLLLVAQATAPQPLAPSAGFQVASLEAADLCGSAAEELAVSTAKGDLAIFRVDEASGRWEAQFVPRATHEPNIEGQMAVADVDGDGRVDLLHEDGVVYNETPAGSSRFVGVDVPTNFAGAQVSRFVGLPDVDGDKLGDPVFLVDTSWSSTRPLVIMRQLSPRVFAAPQPFAVTPLRAGTLIDADGDGYEEFAVVTEDLRLQIWESGTPAPAPTVLFDAQVPPPSLAPNLYDIVADDLDGDGMTDLVVVGSEVTVFRGLGAATFALSGTFSAIQDPGDVRLVDVDRDGDRDLVIHRDSLNSYAGGRPVWVERTGAVSFDAPARFVTQAPATSFAEVAAPDLDGDGVRELVGCRNFGDLGIAELPASPATPAVFRRMTSGPALGPATAAIDLDGDGDRDLVGADRCELVAFETIAPGETRERVRVQGVCAGAELVPVALAGQPGEFAVATVSPVGVFTVTRDLFGAAGPIVHELGTTYIGAPPRTLAACDQDGDGDEDLLALSFSGAAIEVARQSATGVFEAPEVVAQPAPGARFRSFLPCEWDGAPPMDLVVDEGSGSTTSIRLLRGTSAGFVDAGPPQAIPGILGTMRAAAPPGRPMGVYLSVGPEILRCETTPAGALMSPVSVLTASPYGIGDFRVDTTTTLSPFGRIVTVQAQYNPGRLTAYPLGGAAAPTVLGATPWTVEIAALDDIDGDGALDALLSTDIGLWWARGRADAADLAPYCRQSELNSLGLGARLRARAGEGQAGGAASTLRFDAVDLPPGATTLFLTGRRAAALPGAGGALGTLCLGGTLGRFVAPGQVLTANAGGAAGQDVDPLALPSGGQLLPVAVGDVWAFQAWYRDVDAAGNPVSRLTDAVLATF